MVVRIDEINVEKVGPISELQMALGPFNLVYGRNEQGKTFLVEFLIRSLFKNLSGWSLRNIDSRGKVSVSGLIDKPLELTPASRRKLEDYLAESESGLPTRISRLLVVKGAELSFEENVRHGISQAVLKEFLSGQGILDDIQRRISKTIQNAEVVDGRISGRHQGEIARMKDAAFEKDGIDNLFEQIGTIYSGGERQALQTRLAGLKNEIAVQNAAKRHQAYLHDQRIEALKEQLNQFPEEELERLDDDLKAYVDTQRRIARIEEQLETLNQRSEHYEWLEQAIPLYEQRGRQGKFGGGIILPVLIIFSLFLAIITSFLSFPLGTFFFIVIAMILGLFYWRQLRMAVNQAVNIEEIKKLEEEFKHRFGQRLSGLPIMQKTKKTIEEAYYITNNKRENLHEEQDKLAALRDEIASRMYKLTGNTSEPESWIETKDALLGKRKTLTQELNELEKLLVALSVSETNYQVEPASDYYDPVLLHTLQEELEKVNEELNAKNDELDKLKHRICQETKDEITINWETLIENLQQKREKVAAYYRRLAAEVLAGILVNKALDMIRSQEDEKIRRKLASEQVCIPIQRITRRYTGVRYDDGELIATDAFGGFPISELSTGTCEQMLLGLRLGFAAQILGHDRLFLLLDDAFQHADWQRRGWLMEQMVDLAQDGWQIIYFTMDDHIKRLFDAAGQRFFSNDYKCFDLTAQVTPQ